MKPWEETEGYILFCEAMRRGDLQPGQQLTQNELCAVLGLSLTPLRETLVLLQAYGLVTVRPRTGIQVIYPDVRFIRENFQFRILIETHALDRLIQSDAGAWVAEMAASHERCHQALAETGDADRAISDFLQLDRRFHAELVDILGNAAIAGQHRRLLDNISLVRLTHKKLPVRVQLLEAATEHLAILDALQRGEKAEAVAALEAHFMGSTHRLFAC